MLFSTELPCCYFCAEIEVLGMIWKSMEQIFGINKKYLRNNQRKGAHTLSTRVQGAPTPWGAPPASWAPYCSTDLNANSIYSCSGREKSEKRFIAFYDTEPPPSPNLSWEGWSGVRSGLRRGGSVAVVIINHPPSPISWCSPSCVSNSIVGLLDGDWLDEIL